MKRTSEQIKALIKERKLRGISVDTSIFCKAGLRLEGGVLARLEQFRDSGVVFLLPDVIHAELRKHLLDASTDAFGRAVHAAGQMGRIWGLTKEDIDAALARLSAGRDASTLTDERLKAYLELIKAEVLQSERLVSLGKILSDYFSGTVPFENKETKKHEFPDAIALHTLEAWARKNKSLILVVSSDKGWIDFSEESENLIALDDLSQALALFQDEAESHNVRLFARSVLGTDPEGVVDTIKATLNEESWRISFDVQADSDYEYESEIGEIVLKEIDIASLDEDSFVLIDGDGDSYKVSLNLECTFDVETSFSFSKWDSIDKEHLPLGNGSASNDVNVDVEVILHLSKDENGELIVEDVELVESEATVECGEVSPDWMNDPSNFE